MLQSYSKTSNLHLRILHFGLKKIFLLMSIFHPLFYFTLTILYESQSKRDFFMTIEVNIDGKC